MEKPIDSLEQYQYALKRGKENVHKQRQRKLNTHPLVLEEITDIRECSKEDLGVMYVPARLII